MGAEIIAFEPKQQAALNLLYNHLKNGNIRDINSINLADDLIQSGKKYRLFEDQLYWVERLTLGVQPSYEEVTTVGNLWNRQINPHGEKCECNFCFDKIGGSPARRLQIWKKRHNMTLQIKPIVEQSSGREKYSRQPIIDEVEGDPLKKWRKNNMPDSF